jgi:hypothetical protein
MTGSNSADPGTAESGASRFDAAFDAHYLKVLAFALRRMESRAEAEDAMAETFAVAWRRRDANPDRSPVRLGSGRPRERRPITRGRSHCPSRSDQPGLLITTAPMMRPRFEKEWWIGLPLHYLFDAIPVGCAK